MDDDLLVAALRWMMLSRLYDERAITKQRQGKIGVYSPVMGQEAAVVGSMLAVQPDKDWLVPTYREHIACVRHGWPLERLTAAFMGKVASARIPDGVKLLPNPVALAAQLPHATGLAWGLKLQQRPGVVLAYVGEGASSEGDFHEALNIAGVTKAPIVILLQNNQWAISTPRSLQTAAASFAVRAAGYGFPGVAVDGNDLLAVYEATLDAVERARNGEGPTLIEAVTYRMGAHNTTDNPSRYMNSKEYSAATRRDPITRVAALLFTRGLWDKHRERQVRDTLRTAVDDAFESAAAFPPAEPDQLFEHVWEREPIRFKRQRVELLGRDLA